MPSTDPPPKTDAPTDLVARLEAEVLARDRYIQNLAARNLLLRMQVRDLKYEIRRRRSKPI
jgi:hypothetical protein